MLYSPKTASQLFTSWKYIIAADEPNIYETSRECAHKHHLPTPQTSSRCDFSDSASQSAAAESKCPSATNLSMRSGLTMDNGPLTGFFLSVRVHQCHLIRRSATPEDPKRNIKNLRTPALRDLLTWHWSDRRCETLASSPAGPWSWY